MISFSSLRPAVLYTIVILIFGLLGQSAAFYFLCERTVRDTDERLLELAHIIEASGKVSPDTSGPRGGMFLKDLAEQITREEIILLIGTSGIVWYAGTDDASLAEYLAAADSPSDGPMTLVTPTGTSLRTLWFSLPSYGRLLIAAPLPSLWQSAVEGSQWSWFLLPMFLMAVSLAVGWLYVDLLRPSQDYSLFLNALPEKPVLMQDPSPLIEHKGPLRPLFEAVSMAMGKLIRSRNQALLYSAYASHELRTSLTLLQNQLEGGLDIGERNRRRIISKAYDETMRVRTIVDDLLDLSIIQSGSLRMPRQPVNLGRFLQDFHEASLDLTRPKDIAVGVSGYKSVTILADPARLKQIFFGLLDNSIKNSPKGSEVVIMYAAEGDQAVVRFSDTGHGIPPEDLPNLFQPYVRKSRGDNMQRGTGLGLAIIKWIVELHDGTITVESTSGNGTTFVMRFPLEETRTDQAGSP